LTRGSWATATLKVLAVLALGVLVQTTFGNDLRVHDVAPDFMMLLAVSSGFVGGPDQGAVVGFSSGFVADLFLQGTPVGLSALAGCLAGFSVGWLRANYLRARLVVAPLVVAAGTVLALALYVVVGYIVGQQQLVAPGDAWLVGVAAVEAVYAAVFALPAVALMAWALKRPSATPAALSQTAVEGLPGTPDRRQLAAARSPRRHRRSPAGVR